MKSIEFRRHSVRDGATGHLVGPLGMKLARLVGEQQLRGRAFTSFTVSFLWRTTQTMVGFDEGAGDFKPPRHLAPQVSLHEHRSIKDDAMGLWYGPGRKAKAEGRDMLLAALEEEPAATNVLAADYKQIVLAWLDSLPENTRALVVGHSPALEILAYGVTGITIPQLQFCDGFRLEQEDGDIRLIDDETTRATALLAKINPR